MKDKKPSNTKIKNIFKSNKQLSQEEKIYRSYRLSIFFKLFFYVLGFPLLTYFAIVYSSKLYGMGSYNKTWSYAIIVIMVLWLIIGIAQFIFNKYKKSFMSRAIFIVVVTLVLILLSILGLSVKSQKIVNKAKEEYSFYGVNIPPLEKQYETFLPYTTGGGDAAAFGASMRNFDRVYGVGLKSGQIGGLNTDGTLFKHYTDDKKSVQSLIELANKKNEAENIPSLNLWKPSKEKPINYFFDGDANYSTTAKDHNDIKKGNFYLSSGLYADGMLFGLKQVYDIIYVNQKAEESIRVNGYKLSDGTVTHNPDEVLISELNDVHKKAEYNNYKSAYLENHSDDKGKYNLDEERFNKIIKSVASVLNLEITGSTSGLNVVDAIMGVAKVNDIKGIIDLVNKLTSKDLTVNQALSFVAALVPFIQSSARPDIMFLDNSKLLIGTDVTVREYALARYYGLVHGSVVSTVVLPNENGRIGRIDMSRGGVLASENALSAQALKQIEADNSYMPTLHPIMLLRRILISGLAWLIVMLLISTYFGVKKDIRFKELTKIKAAKESYVLLTDEEKELLREKLNNKNNNENIIKDEVKKEQLEEPIAIKESPIVEEKPQEEVKQEEIKETPVVEEPIAIEETPVVEETPKVKKSKGIEKLKNNFKKSKSTKKETLEEEYMGMKMHTVKADEEIDSTVDSEIKK